MSKRYVTVRWNKKAGNWDVVGPNHKWWWETIKTDAVKEGRALAKELRTELVVYNKNGKIGWRNSYGKDSKSRKG